MNKTLVSIIIPTYKNRGGLKETIESIKKQSYQEIEIIVVDDNGKGTEKQIETETLCKKFDVKYIAHEQNRNGAAARNTGIFASSGFYVGFCDDDDCFFPEKIAMQVDFLNNNEQFEAVYCYAKKNGVRVNTKFLEGNLTKDLLLMKCFLQTSTLLFRRKAIMKLQGFDESFRRHQDYELMLRFFKEGYKVGLIPEELVVMGLNQGENIPAGQKMELLKIQYLGCFDSVISSYGNTFKRKVYAKHFVKVFFEYLKAKEFGSSIRIFYKYLWHHPSILFSSIFESFKYHILK